MRFRSRFCATRWFEQKGAFDDVGVRENSKFWESHFSNVVDGVENHQGKSQLPKTLYENIFVADGAD